MLKVQVCILDHSGDPDIFALSSVQVELEGGFRFAMKLFLPPSQHILSVDLSIGIDGLIKRRGDRSDERNALAYGAPVGIRNEGELVVFGRRPIHAKTDPVPRPIRRLRSGL